MFFAVQYPCESTALTFHHPNLWCSLKVRAVTGVKLVSERRWAMDISVPNSRRVSPVQDIRPWSRFGIRMGLDSGAFRSVMKICDILRNMYKRTRDPAEIAKLRLWGGPIKLRPAQECCHCCVPFRELLPLSRIKIISASVSKDQEGNCKHACEHLML